MSFVHLTRRRKKQHEKLFGACAVLTILAIVNESTMQWNISFFFWLKYDYKSKNLFDVCVRWNVDGSCRRFHFSTISAKTFKSYSLICGFDSVLLPRLAHTFALPFNYASLFAYRFLIGRHVAPFCCPPFPPFLIHTHKTIQFRACIMVFLRISIDTNGEIQLLAHR